MIVTVTKTVIVDSLPRGIISGTTVVCINSTPNPVITFTGINGTPPYTFTYTINGVSQPTISTTGTNNSITLNASTGTAGGEFTITTAEPV